MKLSLRILEKLTIKKGTVQTLHARIPDVHMKSVQCTLSQLAMAGLVAGQRMSGTHLRTLEWSITDRGRAELRREGIGVAKERPSPFGLFGERIGRVRSVFDLPQVLSNHHLEAR